MGYRGSLSLFQSIRNIARKNDMQKPLFTRSLLSGSREKEILEV